MKTRLLCNVLFMLYPLGLFAQVITDTDLCALLDQAELRDTIRGQNEGALIDESTDLEQSKTLARSRSDYGLELRPSVSDNDAGMALRIYLPDRWSKKRLREQLALAAKSEQMRVAALEWKDVVGIYREFCTYRMLAKKLELTESEIRFIEPYLEKADQSVALNQLRVSDRARLYSTYLAMVNDHGKLMNDYLDSQRIIRMVVGPDADLKRLSSLTVIEMPSRMEIKSLLRTALDQRTDYRQIGIDMRAMQLAEEAARTEDGFRLKYIQPAYRVDYEDGTDGWEFSAAIVLPWGTRNPDIAVYQHQQDLYLAAQSQQRKLIEDRLRVLLDTSESYYAQLAKKNQRIKPVIEGLKTDLETMGEVPLEQIRDILSIRERMLQASLLSTESEYRTETLAVDLADELGGWK